MPGFWDVEKGADVSGRILERGLVGSLKSESLVRREDRKQK